MPGKEGFDYKVAGVVETKSKYIGAGALGFALVASVVSPVLILPALEIAALEGAQYAGAKWYKDRQPSQ